jgi:hypothetical protein
MSLFPIIREEDESTESKEYKPESVKPEKQSW